MRRAVRRSERPRQTVGARRRRSRSLRGNASSLSCRVSVGSLVRARAPVVRLRNREIESGRRDSSQRLSETKGLKKRSTSRYHVVTVIVISLSGFVEQSCLPNIADPNAVKNSRRGRVLRMETPARARVPLYRPLRVAEITDTSERD